MKKNKLFAIVMILSMLCMDVFAQSGANDPSFDPTYQGFDAGTGANRAVYSTSLQTDEKIIIAGSFTYFNGSSRRRIARLNTDGSVDITFDPGSGASQNSTIYTTSLQSDGKIIIGGTFTSYNQVQRSRVARVNTDGTLDGTFNPGSGTGMNSTVYASAIQSDGKIIFGGYFSSYNNKSRNCIARANANGGADTTFTPGTGANNTIYAVAIQTDGKILIGGSFTSFNGTSINRIARLNADGSLDASFVPGTGAGGTIRTVALQSDGKIVIGGNFTSFNGTTVNRIARLNSDGTIDNSFVPGAGASAYVRKAVIQTDGKIVIGGEFVTFNAVSKKRIVRLNSDGSMDASFLPGSGADSNIVAMAVKGDGKIIIGGDFTFYDGTSRNYFARLNSDGSLDSTCVNCSGANEVVRSANIQNDAKIIIAGYFTFFNGTGINRVARLNTDGSLDDTFDPGSGPDGGVTTSILQGDGRIFIAGNFESVNGTPLYRVARLNTDGSVDVSFTPDSGANKIIYAAAIQSDGKIVIGGEFDSVSDTPRSRIARLNSNGTLDVTFNPGTGTDSYITAIAIQSDGKIIIGGMFTSYNGTTSNYIARLNSDGSFDATFNTGTGANGIIRTVTIQSNGKILIGGSFSTYNGTSVNRVARLNTDGSIDASFNPGGAGASGSVYSILAQNNGKIYISGIFTSYNGTSRNRIARLNSDGTLDNAFDPGTGSNNIIFTSALQADEKIIIGGGFTTYNGADRYRIARIMNTVVVGLDENSSENEMSLYPNPTSGLINLVSAKNLENASLIVKDVEGRVILEKEGINGSHFSFDISGQSKGIYFIEIIQEKVVLRSKIVKN